MVSGRLQLTLGHESVRLDVGDAFTFPGREPHTWANGDATGPCDVLWVLAPAP